jgi:GDP-4-dehydro-6-deoxy-D-mannose reductase
VRILVTGAAGFVGSHLLRLLRAEFPEASLHGTVLLPEHKLAVADAHAHALNLMQSEDVAALVADVRPDRIYHLAAFAVVHRSFDDPWATLENNIRTQLNVLEACVKADTAPRIVLVTSGEVYGAEQSDDVPTSESAPMRPANPYAVSKVAQDMLGLQYWLSHSLPIMRARPFNHLGPGQGPGFVAPDFARQIAQIEAGQQPPVITCGDLSAERDFTDVRDIVRAYLSIAEHGTPGEAYNVASGSTVAIQHILDLMLASSTVSIHVESRQGHVRSSGVHKSWGDATRLRQATGWQPRIPLAQTVNDVLDDWRARIGESLGKGAT